MNNDKPVKLFSITRISEQKFIRDSFLGRSLSRFPNPLMPSVHIQYNNTGKLAIGLSEYYNRCLEGCEPQDIVIFVHDDVYIHSWFLIDQLREAINHFDIVGLAGSSNPDLNQPSWGLTFSKTLKPMGWQKNAGFSGSVGHSTPEAPQISYYGKVPSSCLLLDGLFLTVNVEKLKCNNVNFDEAFKFHFYDIDFCRSAQKAGLNLGTWRIPVTHASGGSFNTESWHMAARVYLKKWQ